MTNALLASLENVRYIARITNIYHSLTSSLGSAGKEQKKSDLFKMDTIKQTSRKLQEEARDVSFSPSRVELASKNGKETQLLPGLNFPRFLKNRNYTLKTRNCALKPPELYLENLEL